MKISIVIVSWNVKELLTKCLESIKEYGSDFDVEIFVIDNASSDGTPWMVKNDFPEVNLIVNSDNAGFARANNQGIKRATGDYILLLNPDTEIFKDTLSKSVQYLQDHPEVGILGCQMQYKNGKLQPSVRRWPRVWPVLLMLLKLPKIFKHLKSIENYLATDFDYNKAQEVNQVMGAFMMMSRKSLDMIGLMDERFFIWFEEVDYCWRAHQAGLKVAYDSEVRIIHYGGQSFDQQKVVKKQWNFFVSAYKYFKKNGFR